MWKSITEPNEVEQKRTLQSIILKEFHSIPTLDEPIQFHTICPNSIYKEYIRLKNGEAPLLLQGENPIARFKTAVSNMKPCYVIDFENKANVEHFQPYSIQTSSTIYIIIIILVLFIILYSQYNVDVYRYWLMIGMGMIILYFGFYFTY